MSSHNIWLLKWKFIHAGYMVVWLHFCLYRWGCVYIKYIYTFVLKVFMCVHVYFSVCLSFNMSTLCVLVCLPWFGAVRPVLCSCWTEPADVTHWLSAQQAQEPSSARVSREGAETTSQTHTHTLKHKHPSYTKTRYILFIISKTLTSTHILSLIDTHIHAQTLSHTLSISFLTHTHKEQFKSRSPQ